MKFRVEIIEKEGNPDIFQEDEVISVPLYVETNAITAAYPTGDKKYINVFFGDWLSVKYSDEVWKELQQLLG